MKRFLKDLLERVVGTVAATAVAMIPLDMGLESVDWKTIASVSLLAGVVTGLKAVAARYKGDRDSGGLVE